MRLNILLCLLVWGFLAHGGDDVTVDFPLVDAPFNFLDGSYLAPSMRQSLAMSSDFYEVTHRSLLGPAGQRPVWRYFVVAGVDILTMYTPAGSAWLHEEWHRAVMSRRGISSYDDIYGFPIGQEVVAVSHVTDEDLERLKRDHPAEQVRMSAAGMEAQVAQNLYVERNQFFRENPANNRMLFWINDFGVLGYLGTCASSSANKTTDRLNREDGSDVPKRDFTGLDCTAWVYDLFRPDEPYAARGGHPSGVGYDRYIRWDDLSPGEKNFLKRQVALSGLNFADPFLFGFDEFKSDWMGGVRWNARLSHALTSFGYVVDAHLMVKTGEQKVHMRWHNGFNDRTYFPGLSLSWIDFPLAERWFLTTDLTVWNQPKAQRYDSKGGEMLAAGGVETAYAFSPRARAYVGVNAKTPGWMMGEVFLDRTVTLWTGLRAVVF